MDHRLKIANERTPWTTAVVAALSNLMPSMMVATLGIALPEVRQSFSLSEIEAGGLFSILMTVAAVTSAVAGRLADRLGRKTVLIAGLSFLALGFAAAGFADHRWVFFFFLGITGLGYGFTPPSLYAVMSDLLPGRRGLGSSLVSVSYGIGGAIGALLASQVIATAGWRIAFVTVGAIGAADMLLQFCWIRNNPAIRAASRAGSFKATVTLPILILALAECIGGSVFWSSAAWMPTLLRTAKRLTLEETGWVMGLLSIANMLGSFCLGGLSDRIGRWRVIVLSAVPAAVAAWVVLYGLESTLWISLGIFLFGTLKASVPALIVAMAQEAAPPGNAGTASGIIMSLHYTAGVIAPLIAARLITATDDIIIAMILVTTLPLMLYGGLIAATQPSAGRH